MKQPALYTIGHSTRSEEDFLKLLRIYHIEILVDIRTLPRSRWNPQFNQTTLEKSITKAGMKYLHRKELGGLRETSPKSINIALENAALRGYADHMQTPQFEKALLELIGLSRKRNVAIMCAEASYAKCHRRLTSDAFTAHGLQVLHILDAESIESHVLSEFALVDGKKVTYPMKQSQLDF